MMGGFWDILEPTILFSKLRIGTMSLGHQCFLRQSTVNGTGAKTGKVALSHLVPSWWTRNGRWRKSSPSTCYTSSRSQCVVCSNHFSKLHSDIPGRTDSHWSWFWRRRGGWGSLPSENGAFLFPPWCVADRTIPVSLLSSGWDHLPLPEKT